MNFWTRRNLECNSRRCADRSKGNKGFYLEVNPGLLREDGNNRSRYRFLHVLCTANRPLPPLPGGEGGGLPVVGGGFGEPLLAQQRVEGGMPIGRCGRDRGGDGVVP
jgi:hypothetical protein